MKIRNLISLIGFLILNAVPCFADNQNRLDIDQESMQDYVENRSYLWRKGVTGLVNQVISNIPPGEIPAIGVMEFKDLRNNKTTTFSNILKEDINTILARAENIKLKIIFSSEDDWDDDLAQTNNLDFYISGSYRMEKGGLDISARLIETKTSTINASGNTLIRRKAINPEDLVLLDPKGMPIDIEESNDSYQETLEKLVAMKPDRSSFGVKVWTNKKEYQIGEKLVFSVMAEKNGYLTLLDVNPKGNITVIFPNQFHRDNFIRAGVTYQVPSPKYGFEFNVGEPAGLERVKAIVTRNKISLLNLNLNEGFHSVKRGTTRGNRDIKAVAKKILTTDGSDWAEASSELFIFKEGKAFTRGSRSIPLPEDLK
jgi:TolB-like protein